MKKGDKVVVTKKNEVVDNPVVEKGMEGEIVGKMPPVASSDGKMLVTYEVDMYENVYIVSEDMIEKKKS